MSIAVQFLDETIGAPTGSFRDKGPRVKLVSQTATAREILLERVAAEWKSRRARLDSQPKSREELSIWMHDIVRLDCAMSEEDAVKEAIRALSQGEYLFFWNDEQVVDPDLRLTVLDENEALFLRLFPLKGG